MAAKQIRFKGMYGRGGLSKEEARKRRVGAFAWEEKRQQELQKEVYTEEELAQRKAQVQKTVRRTEQFLAQLLQELKGAGINPELTPKDLKKQGKLPAEAKKIHDYFALMQGSILSLCGAAAGELTNLIRLLNSEERMLKKRQKALVGEEKETVMGIKTKRKEKPMARQHIKKIEEERRKLHAEVRVIEEQIMKVRRLKGEELQSYAIVKKYESYWKKVADKGKLPFFAGRMNGRKIGEMVQEIHWRDSDIIEGLNKFIQRKIRKG